MAAGIGIDLVEIDRVERALRRRPRLRQRLFTAAEIAFAEGRARPARHLAARFAAKEAVIKALGGAPIPPSEVEIEGGGSVEPRVRLTGRAAAVAGGRAVSVSLTHSRESAAAVALAAPR